MVMESLMLTNSMRLSQDHLNDCDQSKNLKIFAFIFKYLHFFSFQFPSLLCFFPGKTDKIHLDF